MSRRWLSLVFLAGAAPLVAQGVMIAPTAVVMDHRTRSGNVTLYNPGNEPVEVRISSFFGYWTTDSTGALSLHEGTAADSAAPSAAGWIQAFPRRLTVAPLERQTIRLLATPPAGLPDGEYWMRLVFEAKAGAVPVSGVADTSKIVVGLQLQMRTIIGVAYRKGSVHTGVAVSNLRARPVDDSVEVRVRLERQGNAAFVGTVKWTVTDSAGKTLGELASPIGVYFRLEPRYRVPVGVLPRGRYWVKVEANTDRADPEGILRAPAVRDSLALVVP